MRPGANRSPTSCHAGRHAGAPAGLVLTLEPAWWRFEHLRLSNAAPLMKPFGRSSDVGRTAVHAPDLPDPGALMDLVSCVSCVSWMHWVNAAETHETVHQ